MAKKVNKKRASLLEKIEVEKKYSVDEAYWEFHNIIR